MKENAIWITWERQRRNITMANKLEVEYVELFSDKFGIGRYFELVIRTFSVIKEKNPEVVFVQNPSIVLCAFSIILRMRYGYRLVIDEHNAGLFPFEGRYRAFNFVARKLVQYADFVIVTNNALAEICINWGGSPLVIPDPLPEFSSYLVNKNRDFVKENSTTPTSMLFICSWSDDEPWELVLNVARRFEGNDLEIKVTGNPKSKLEGVVLPGNVKMTGFLIEEDYMEELSKCDGVIVLTKRENCLNCGAYEAVAMEKPGILTDTRVLRDYFNAGFLFAKPESENSLTDCLMKFLENRDMLKDHVKKLKSDLESSCKVLEEVEAALDF